MKKIKDIEIEIISGAKKIETIKNNINFKNVCFYYESSKRKVLDNISFNIKKNKIMEFMVLVDQENLQLQI